MAIGKFLGIVGVLRFELVDELLHLQRLGKFFHRTSLAI